MQISCSKAIYGLASCADALQGRHAFVLFPPHERLLNVERSYHYVRAVIPLMSAKPEHLVSDKTSHIYGHLQNSQHCLTVCSDECFNILDHASTTLQLKIKEAIHIQWEQHYYTLSSTLTC